MTMEELRRCDRPMLSGPEAASLLGMHPQTLNLKAKEGTLPFPSIRSGNRTKVPRLSLMRWLGMDVLEEADK